MLKLDLMLVYYIVTLILCQFFHKHNEKRVTTSNVRTKNNEYYIKNER